jgi:hypothetical protein
MGNRLLTLPSLAFGSEGRRLHTRPATSVSTASMAPAPVAVTVLATFHLVIVATLHTVIVLPVPSAIVILSTHRQPDYGENH